MSAIQTFPTAFLKRASHTSFELPSNLPLKPIAVKIIPEFKLIPIKYNYLTFIIGIIIIDSFIP